MMRTLALMMLALIVASCGVKRPLIRPMDIPAYEEQQRKKREKLEQDESELNRIDADAAITTGTEPAK
ncbi:MAG: hypothetical protein K2X09_02055 [Rickettsiales bacterium]|nr:hypothetical protein [Rickettsiales bacterium]